MPVAAGSTIVAPTVGQVLAEATFPWPRTIRAIIVISCTYNFDGLFEVWDGNGQVIWDMVLPVAGGLWASPALGPLVIPTNGRLRVLSRNTPVLPGVLEVQASIHWRDWGER